MTHEKNPPVASASTSSKRARWPWLIAASLCGACALMRTAKPESLPDGSYQLTCKSPLDACLASLDSVCRDGYDVIRATEKRQRFGPPPEVQVYASSEAVVRCRIPEPLFFGSGRASGSIAASDDAAVPDDAAAPDGSTATTTPSAAPEAALGIDP